MAASPMLASSAPPSPAHICPFAQACSYLDWAAGELKLDPGWVAILS